MFFTAISFSIWSTDTVSCSQHDRKRKKSISWKIKYNKKTFKIFIKHDKILHFKFDSLKAAAGNTKGGSITVPLTSGLTGLD